MSVLIKGMEIPKQCNDCRMLEGDQYDGFCHAADKWMDSDWWSWYTYEEGDIDTSKPANCPLTPVPPHGRLIDADELMQIIREHDYPLTAYPLNSTDNGMFTLGIQQAVDETPTVVEAEAEGDTKNETDGR